MDLKKEVEHWVARKEALEEWLIETKPSHPNWEQNRRDLNFALQKIKSLKIRDKRAFKKFKGIEEYSMPVRTIDY